MSDAATPGQAPVASGTEHSVAEAARRIEGLLGPAPAGKPAPESAASSDDPAPEPDDAEAELDAATQPAEGDAEADDEPSSDEDADADPAPADKTPSEIEVTLPGGEKAKVTLDELKRGYSREADYSKKTMALAEEKRAFDGHVQRQAQAFKQGLDTLQAELDRLIPSEKTIDWDALHQRDPAEYVKWKEYFRDLKDKRQAVAQEQHALHQQAMQRAERETAETLKRESELLVKALPVFADPKKGDAAKAELRSYLVSKGYTPEQIAGLSDHRSVTIAWKAAQYDKLQSSKPQIDKRVVGLPKVQKPGAAVEGDAVSRQKITSLEQKLRKTGRVEDAAALLMSRM